ncbi:hypothetical protein DL93DRAFT_2078331 [Clavulina sp. PMI_390]|nr:hypothetical protein DL93DRAFT_2078331 [Clavulina sp. PMI_390]
MPGGGSLNLKWTSVDEEAHQWRKAKRAARKAHHAAGPAKFSSSLASGRFRSGRSASPSSSYAYDHDPDAYRDDEMIDESSNPRAESSRSGAATSSSSRTHSKSKSKSSKTASTSTSSSRSRSHRPHEHPLEDEFNAHHLPPESLSQLYAELEEARFRAKLADALGDDMSDERAQRLDMLEASFNAHVHIPSRWANPNSDSTSSSDPAAQEAGEGIDPSLMTEEQYAEWIRQGMWRRTHRTEVESAERRAREREARRERDREARKAVEAEERERRRRWDKEERAREERRQREKEEHERVRRGEVWITYGERWEALRAAAAAVSAATGELDGTTVSGQAGAEASTTANSPKYTFNTLPWPTEFPPASPASLTKSAISSFLRSYPYISSSSSTSSSASGDKYKSQKQLIREALLAYHPDRFVGRYMSLVASNTPADGGGDGDAAEKEKVMEGVLRVTGVLNTLLEEESNAASAL